MSVNWFVVLLAIALVIVGAIIIPPILASSISNASPVPLSNLTCCRAAICGGNKSNCYCDIPVGWPCGVKVW